jgi:hypothetical protein
MQPSERRLSDIDRFCIQTQETGKAEAERRVRFVASVLGIVCLVLLMALGAAIWQSAAVAQERDALAQELRAERTERVKATLAARDAEIGAANFALDTRVRRDIVDEQMLAQERRSAELEQLALTVEREKLVRADCVTPRSLAAGL